jgi:hypothetical protein
MLERLLTERSRQLEVGVDHESGGRRASANPGRKLRVALDLRL